jgi:flagellar biosynthesis chaperone FliJ
MKSLYTLIKFNKTKLDKILVEIKKAEEEKALLVTRANNLAEEISKEVSAYHGSEYSFMLEQYLENTSKIQSRIKTQIERLELHIERRRQALNEQYAELKKYEIAMQNKQKQEYLKIQKTETQFLDEFGANKYIYNKK